MPEQRAPLRSIVAKYSSPVKRRRAAANGQ
jgi:hypothetical protein